MKRIRWTATTCAAALAAVVLAAAPAAAQSATVRGQVVDTRSGQPVAHAAVYVTDNRTAAVADAQGRFEVKHLRPGTRAIWADAPGYTMEMAMVEVPEGEVDVTLQMQSDPVRLATLEVTTSRFDRRADAYAGSVRVFRQHDLATMWYSNVAEMLESRARLKPTLCSGYARFGRLNCVTTRGGVVQSKLVVDEANWLGGPTDLRDLNLADVARVEIFGGGREIRVYTRQFMDWASKRPYVPTPLGLGT
jgi:hypothetical protein